MRLSLIYILNQFSFFSGVFPITVPPCKGTHGDRIAGDNSTRLTQGVTIAIPSLRSLRSRHNQRHFPYYATSSAWQLRNRTPRILVQPASPTLDAVAAVAAPIPSSNIRIKQISIFNQKNERALLKYCVRHSIIFV